MDSTVIVLFWGHGAPSGNGIYILSNVPDTFIVPFIVFHPDFFFAISYIINYGRFHRDYSSVICEDYKRNTNQIFSC